MSDLRNVKTFGGVGALLMLLGSFIPYAGPILAIVGFVLVFIAVKNVSELTKDKDIFKNYLYNFILGIIAIIAFFIILLIGFGAAGGFSWIQSLQDINITDFSSFWNYFGEIIIYALIGLFIAWILLVIGAIYLRRCYKSIADHTKISMFGTTGTVYLIGSILTIILIGFLILFIARIMEIIAYFSLPDDLPGKIDKEKSARKCPHCDKVIPEDAVVCPYCGKKF
jgi:uncharacterized membrane protein